MERSDSFGYWLRRRRKARDLTQQELADQAGCTVAMIRRIEADELANESLAIAVRLGEPRLKAEALLTLGQSASVEGDLTNALTLLEESLQQFTGIGDPHGRAEVLAALGFAYRDRPQAAGYYSESLALARAIGDDAVSAFAATKLGEEAAQRGEFELADAYIREGVGFARKAGDQDALGIAAYVRANVTLARGQLSQAEAQFAASLADSQKQHDLAGIVLKRGALGRIAYWQGDPELARQHHLEGLALLGDSYPVFRPRFTAMLGKLAEAAGDLIQAAAYHAESLELYRANEDRIGVAWAQRNLGYVQLMQGERTAAARLLCASLAGLLQAEAGHDARKYYVAVGCLSAAADLIEQRGELNAAALLGGAAEVLQERFPPNPLWYECQPEDRPRVAAAHARLATGAHEPDWASGRTHGLDAALARALHLLQRHTERL